jgi:hypothetical protein
MYPAYCGSPVTAQQSGYDRFLPVKNDWGTIHHVSDMFPPLLVEEGGRQPKKELDSRMNRSTPGHDGHVRVGSYHLSNHYGPSLRPTHYNPLAGVPSGSPVLGKCLRPGVTRHSLRNPCAQDREAVEYWFLIHQSLA